MTKLNVKKINRNFLSSGINLTQLGDYIVSNNVRNQHVQFGNLASLRVITAHYILTPWKYMEETFGGNK